jgi:glycine hydroxymethyltransferase
MKPEFSKYAHQVVENCQVLATGLSEAGMRLVSGGTDNHLVLVDVSPLGITGRQAERALESVGIIANKNAIPFDARPPRVTSGLRLGTPAITSRGMGTTENAQVASMVSRVLSNIDDETMHREVAAEVQQLTAGFPVPGIDD